MNILLSNDDGIYAPGLRSLYRALVDAGHQVTVVAPAAEQSGVGSALSARGPLQARLLNEDGFTGYAVFGTPADCAMLGLFGIFPEDAQPDLVLSGINRGPNSGMDVLFSGTVGAAMQGALAGIPSVAVSNADFTSDSREQARMAVELIGRMDWTALPHNVVYNLNFPACPANEIKGLKVCPHGTRWTLSRFERRVTPDGRPYWWMTDKERLFHSPQVGPDKRRLHEGYMTLSPLKPDFNDENALALLEKMGD